MYVHYVLACLFSIFLAGASLCNRDVRGESNRAGARFGFSEQMSHVASTGGEPIGKNRCSGCGLTFGLLDAFDAHLVGIFSRGERRCISVSEIQGLGMVRNTKGWWIRNIFNGVTPTSGSEDEEERKEVFAATPANC